MPLEEMRDEQNILYWLRLLACIWKYCVIYFVQICMFVFFCGCNSVTYVCTVPYYYYFVCLISVVYDNHKHF